MTQHPPTIQAIIFDCDGTLVDSERLAVTLLCEIAASQGVQISRGQMMAHFQGMRFSLFVEGLCRAYPGLDAAALTQSFREQSLRVLAEQVEPIPGALEFVASQSLPLCVASNGPRIKIETSLGRVGLLDRFKHHIVSAYEINSWKPDPEMVMYSAALLGVPVENCLLVDDSLAGVLSGLNAGSWVAGLGEADFGSVLGHPRFYPVQDFAVLSGLMGRLAG